MEVVVEKIEVKSLVFKEKVKQYICECNLFTKKSYF